MLADLRREVLRIADFIGEQPSEALVDRVVHETTFASVKARAEAMDAEGDRKSMVFEGGAKRFFFKGTNGRWRDVLDESDLALYEAAKARVLEPECARWLEEGGPV